MCDESQRERLLSRVRCYYEILKTSTFGKHIVNRLEKLLSAGMRIQVNSLPPVLPTQAPMAAPQQQQLAPQGGLPSAPVAEPTAVEPTVDVACAAAAPGAEAEGCDTGSPSAQHLQA